MDSDFAITRGDDVTLEIAFVDKDGSAVNITGCVITFNVYHTDAGSLVFSRETGGDGITITNGAAGLADVEIPRSITENLLDEYFFEVELLDSEDKKSTGKRQDFSNPVLTVYPDLIA